MVHEIFATGVISGGAEKVTRQRGAVLYSGQLFKGSEVIVYEAQRAFTAAMSGVWNAYVAAVNFGRKLLQISLWRLTASAACNLIIQPHLCN